MDSSQFHKAVRWSHTYRGNTFDARTFLPIFFIPEMGTVITDLSYLDVTLIFKTRITAWGLILPCLPVTKTRICSITAFVQKTLRLPVLDT